MEPLGAFKDRRLRGLLSVSLHGERCHSLQPGISGEPAQGPSLRTEYPVDVF